MIPGEVGDSVAETRRRLSGRRPLMKSPVCLRPLYGPVRYQRGVDDSVRRRLCAVETKTGRDAWFFSSSRGG